MNNDNYSVLKDFSIRREETQTASAASIERKKDAIIADLSLKCPLTISQIYKKHKLSSKTLTKALVKWGYDVDRLRDQIAEDREPFVKRKGSSWTFEALVSEAAKYKTVKQFSTDSRKAYRVAVKHYKKDQIMGGLYKYGSKWTSALIQEEADQYKHRGEFQKGSSGAYQEAYRLGILNTVCAHMTLNRIKVTYEQILAAAKSCDNKKDFRADFKREYVAAVDRGILAEVTINMGSNMLTFDTIEDIASSCDTKAEFRLHKAAYTKAWRLGKEYLDEITAHMVDGRGRK